MLLLGVWRWLIRRFDLVTGSAVPKLHDFFYRPTPARGLGLDFVWLSLQAIMP
jgi:hypothetical protein